MAKVQVMRDDHARLAGLDSCRAREDVGVAEIRSMIEELRVSLFRAGLRTAYPMSDKRIGKAMTAAWPPRASAQ